MEINTETGTQKALEGFDANIEQIMQEWMVPGAAMAIVKDGEVVTTFGDIPMKLSHFHYNIFEGVYLPLSINLDFAFEIDKKGIIHRLVVPFNGDENPIIFHRVTD